MKRALKVLIAGLALFVDAQAEAQERAGVVTTLEGSVTVTRASLPQPAPLKFKDDIFVRDRVATGKDSVARILLGGRAVVTVREHSAVTITEAPGVATVDVAAGRVAVAVAREKMRQGDLVQVKTPNAVAGIRGTVIVAEVFNASHSVVTVLKGTIDVMRLEAGQIVGAATIVNALQRITVAGQAPVSAPERIGPEAARQLGQEFRLAPPRATPPAATAAVNAGEVNRAAKDLAALPRRVAADRRLRSSVVDDDVDDVSTQEGRGVPSREKGEKVGKLESGPKGRAEIPSYEAPPAVKAPSRTVDAVYPVTDATKYSDKSNRGKGGRDR
jgi:FecR-like protein